MKKSKFSNSQIMDALKRVQGGLPVPEVCREFGISTAMFYQWRSRYGGMDTSMMARQKQFEEESRRLKKMYADERLKAEMVSEALAVVRPSARREMAQHVVKAKATPLAGDFQQH